MKIKRIISILVLVCFSFMSLFYVPEKDAEAVVPVIVPILVDAVISVAASAGITWGINEYYEHMARNEISKLTPQQLAALQAEGGLSELTVDEYVKHGYRKPKNFKKAYKIKGLAKAGLIGGLLSGIISGVPYLIDYISTDDVDIEDGIERSVLYNTYTGVADGTEILYSGSFNVGEYYSISGNDCRISNTGGSDPFYRSWVSLYNGTVEISRYSGVIKTLEGNKIAVRKIYDGEAGEDKILVYVDDVEVHRFGYRFAKQPILEIKAIDCEYDLIGDFSLGTNVYNYTGSVTPTISDFPQVQANRQRLEQVKDNPDKYVIVVQHTDGSTSIQTGTDITPDTGTETPVPDPPPGTDTPIQPGDPTEGSRPDARDLYGVLTTRWPFSLPWDIAYLISLVNAEPVPPRFSFTLPEDFGGHELEINFDHPAANKLMSIVRWFIVFGFCIGIVLVIRKLYGGST